MSFTTIENVQLFLNRDEDLTPFEVQVIEMLIPMVDGVINNYCGLNLLATNYNDKRFSGKGGDTLDLKVFPINSVSSVKIREDASTFTDVTTSVYFVPDDTLLYLDQFADTTSFAPGTNNIFVSFNAGFLTEDMPPELSYAASYLVALNFKKIINEWVAADQAQFEQMQIKLSDSELPILVKRVLDRYRSVAVY